MKGGASVIATGVCLKKIGIREKFQKGPVGGNETEQGGLNEVGGWEGRTQEVNQHQRPFEKAWGKQILMTLWSTQRSRHFSTHIREPPFGRRRHLTQRP